MTARALQAQKISSAGVSFTSQASRKPIKVPQLQLPRWPPRTGAECLHEEMPPRKAGSVNILSVNLGGITLELYDEFCRWLETETTIANIDIICVQETWRLTSDYILPHWSWLSSGAEPVSGQGVAVLVNTAYADTAVLRTREIRVGRILQVQMPVKDDKQGRLLNVVCVYVPSKVSESQYVYEKRAAVWSALDKFLASVPARHFLCVAGDFNTDLQQDAPFVGCTFQWKGHSRAPARDQSTFQNLLRAHSLHAMNTWKHEATYLDHQGSRSRVDYILTRSNTAKGHKSETMPQLHFASWREGGRHLALIGRIDLTSWRNLRSREVNNFQYDKLALVRACQPGPEQDRLKQALVPHLLLLYSGPPPSRVEALLRQLCAETFPAKPATSSLQWQNPEVMHDLERTWTIRRAIDATRIAPLPLLRKAFQIWRLKKQLRLRVKELKKASRQRRRKHWTQQLEEAEKARDAKDAYRFFRVITTLAPRRPMERVQLRDEQGRIMTPEQEDKALAAYWNTIYGRPTVKQRAWTLQEGISIRQEEIYQALRQLKARKAVSPGLAPAAAWKALAAEMSEYLAGFVQQHWQQLLPTSWTTTSLIFLPKAGKTIKQPKDLRPIALQSAASKAITTVVKWRITPSFLEAMHVLPQYAYVRGRSTVEAIARVAAHCSSVRRLVKQQSMTIHDKFAGAVSKECVGGAQLSIDLSKAFDLLPRSVLQEILSTTDLTADEQALIMQWHQQGRYRIRSRGSEEAQHIDLQCGVRQGDVLSPYLWGLFTAYLAKALDAENGSGWTASNGTLYADDMHYKWEFSKVEHMQKMRQDVQNIFAVLRRLGMQANPEKSAFLISVRGTQAKKWVRRFVRKDKQQVRHFHFGGGIDDRVPVAESFTYLGAVLSYNNFELETMKHRLGVAAGHHDRLRKILHAKRVLSVKVRYRLWQVMVQTAQLYALEAVGVTPEGAKMLHVQTLRHLRGIFGSARHVDGLSDHAFLSKYDLPDSTYGSQAQCYAV